MTQLRVALFFITCAAVVATVSPLAPSGASGLVAVGACTSLLTALATVVFARWDRVGLRAIGAWPDTRSLHRFGIGFGIGLTLVLLHTIVTVLIGHTHWVHAPGLVAGDAILTVAGYLALACREELAFHGFALRQLDRRYGLAAAQAIVAVIFAFEHVAGGASIPMAFAGAGIGSLVFGMASIATEGLAIPIGLHAAWNVGDWLRGNKGTPGLWRGVTDRGFEGYGLIAAMIGYVVIMLLATAMFWWWKNRRRGPA
jgi:uncharacterized protein